MDVNVAGGDFTLCIENDFLDVLVRFHYYENHFGIIKKRNLLFRLAFHTFFLTGNLLILHGNEVEGEKSGPLNDHRVPRNTRIAIQFLDITIPTVDRAKKNHSVQKVV